MRNFDPMLGLMTLIFLLILLSCFLPTLNTSLDLSKRAHQACLGSAFVIVGVIICLLLGTDPDLAGTTMWQLLTMRKPGWDPLDNPLTLGHLTGFAIGLGLVISGFITPFLRVSENRKAG